MHRLASLRVLFALGLAVSACKDRATDDPQTPLPEQSSTTQAPLGTGSSTLSCQGVPAHLGQLKRSPFVQVPGTVRAMTSQGSRLWVCGETQNDQGFVALLEAPNADHPTILGQKLLDRPCQGLLLHEQGVALWLREGHVGWLPGGTLDTTLQTSTISGWPRGFDATWPIASTWSSTDQRIYVAAGEKGLRRLSIQGNRLIQDQGFKSPGVYARDLIEQNGRMVIADPTRGVVVWDPKTSALVSSWRDQENSGLPGAHRLVATASGVAVAAGAAGSYQLQWDEPSRSFARRSSFRPKEPTQDILEMGAHQLSLHGSRVFDRDTLIAQSFPGLPGHRVFQRIAKADEKHVWIAREDRLEYRSLEPIGDAPRLVPLVGFGSVSGASASAPTHELAFVVQGHGKLWVEAPKISRGQGLALELEGWPAQVPGCPGMYQVDAGTRLAIRLRITEPEALNSSAEVSLRTSAPRHGELKIDVDINAASAPDMVGQAMPAFVGTRLSDGQSGLVSSQAPWTWIEFLPSSELGSPRATQIMEQLGRWAEEEKRNGKFVLRVRVVLGGPLDKLDPSMIGDVGLNGVELYLDERYALHRRFARLPNERFYPLRLLLDGAGKVVYLDQNLGLASASARFKELKLAW